MAEDIPSNKVPYIIWGAFGNTHLVMVAVSFIAPQSGADPVMVALVVPALAAATVSIGLPKLMPNLEPVTTKYIVRWALAEAPSILGLVSWALSGTHLVQAVCVLAGLTAWAAAFPFDAASWPPPVDRGRGRG